GINACLDGQFASKKLPAEFVLTRFQPEPWEPVDTLSFARYLAYSQAPNWESELIRSRLIARVGYVAAASLEPDVWQPDSDALPRPASSSATTATSRGASRPRWPTSRTCSWSASIQVTRGEPNSPVAGKAGPFCARSSPSRVAPSHGSRTC